MSYTVFRIMTCQANDEGECLRKLLVDPGPDMVVADEAHLLKNEEAKVLVCLRAFSRVSRATKGSDLDPQIIDYYVFRRRVFRSHPCFC